jgi:phospholipid/cholesterol/gamma-HCH transport system substrate-binding protein
MSSFEESSLPVRFKVGLFTLMGLMLLGAITVFVNDKPFWWRDCQHVHMHVSDATGLKAKSPVRSLGLQVGYLESVTLSETNVKLGICVTAPVEVLPRTRAFVRSEGFLGDKFVEIKPLKYLGDQPKVKGGTVIEPEKSTDSESFETSEGENQSRFVLKILYEIASVFSQEVMAEDPPKKKRSREIPVGETTQDVQHLVNEVDKLVGEMTELTTNLKSAINPDELRKVMRGLNIALENAAKTLSPEGGLTSTAQRALGKLDDAIEQLRDMLTRINQGKGSVGKVINDEDYADELKKALKNLNSLLGRASDIRIVLDIGAAMLAAHEGGRGWFLLNIWPSRDRYYRVGVTVDPRGKLSGVTTTTSVGNTTTTTKTTRVEQSGILLTVMFGKVLWDRLDLSVGILHGDGGASIQTNLGSSEDPERFQIRGDVYARSQGPDQKTLLNQRLSLVVFPIRSELLESIYIKGGMESFRTVNGKTDYYYGAGLRFDDKDIKLLFSFL